MMEDLLIFVADTFAESLESVRDMGDIAEGMLQATGRLEAELQAIDAVSPGVESQIQREIDQLQQEIAELYVHLRSIEGVLQADGSHGDLKARVEALDESGLKEMCSERLVDIAARIEAIEERITQLQMREA